MANGMHFATKWANNKKKEEIKLTPNTGISAGQGPRRDTAPSSSSFSSTKAVSTVPGKINWQGGNAYYTDTSIYPRQKEVHNPLNVSNTGIKMAADKAAENWARETFRGYKLVTSMPELTFNNYQRTSPFGQNNGLKTAHNGIDFATPMDTPVSAIMSGTVVQTGNGGTYGNLVKVRHDDGTYGYYGHLNSFNVKAGDKISKGTVIGKTGNTGRSTGPHLHLEVRGEDDSYYNQIDPQRYINGYLSSQIYNAPEQLYYDFKTGVPQIYKQISNEMPVEIPISDKKTITLKYGVVNEIDKLVESMSSDAVNKRNNIAKDNAVFDYLVKKGYNGKVGSDIMSGKLITPESNRVKLPMDAVKGVGIERELSSKEKAEKLVSEILKMNLQGEEFTNALAYAGAKNPTLSKDIGYVAQSALAGLSSFVGGTIDAVVTAPAAKDIERTLGIAEKSTIDENSSRLDKLLFYAKNLWSNFDIGSYIAMMTNNTMAYNITQDGKRRFIKEKYTDEKAKEKGFNNFEEMAKADIEKMYSMTDFFDKPANKLAFKQIGVSDGAKFTGELTQTISYMLPTIAVSALTKNSNFAMGLMSTSAAGNAAKEAYKNGATAEQAYYNGLLKGATEYLTEQIFGGIPVLGKGMLGKNADEIIAKLSKSSIGKFLNSSYGKVVMELLNRGGEGLEEAISRLASGYIDRLTYDDKAELATANEIGRDAFMGILVSFVMNAPMDVVKGISNIKNHTPKASVDATNINVYEEAANNSGEYEHIYDEDKVQKSFIDDVNTEIENAVNDIRNGNIDNVPTVIEVTKLSEKTKKDLSDFVGFDISDYTCKIEKDVLEHIEKRHGIDGKHDQSLSDPKDIARIGYVVNNYDNIEWQKDDNGNITVSKKYNNKNNESSPVILLSAKIDGTYCIGQVIPDTKRKTIWVTSARIQKADVGSQVPNGSSTTPQPTPEAPLVSSSANSKIPQNMNVVKSENVEADSSPNPFKNNSEVSTSSTARETPQEREGMETLPYGENEASKSDNISKLMRGEKVNIKDMSAEEIATLEKEYGFKIKRQKQLDNIAERKELELRLKEGQDKIGSEIFANRKNSKIEDNEEALFSVKKIPGTNKKYVQADRQVIKGDNPEQWAEDVKDYIDTEIRKGKDVNVIGADGEILTITEDTSGKARFRNEVVQKDGVRRTLTDKEYAAKLRAEAHIDEIGQVSSGEGKAPVPDRKNHPFATDGFTYRTAYFKDFDGAYYRLRISVGKNGEINTIYNIGRMTETNYSVKKEASDMRGSKARPDKSGKKSPASNNNISQDEPIVNSNNMQNSEKNSFMKGENLTPQEREGMETLPYKVPFKEADRKKVENIAKVLNREVEWYNDETAVDDMERNSNGVFVPGDVGKKPKIRINENAENPYAVVLGHECFHSLGEKTKKRIIDFIYKNTDTTSEKYQNWKKTIEDSYKANGKTINETTLKEEFAAENMERFFDSEEFLNRLKTEDKSLYEKIKQWVKNLFVRFKNRGIFDLSAAAKASDLTDRQLRKLARMFEVGLKPSTSLQDTSPKVRGLERKYDIKTDKNGKKYWHIESDKDIFKNITNRKELQKAAFQYILKGYKGEDVHTEIDGKKINFTRISAEEYLYGTASKSLNEEAYDKKLRMAPSIMDLIENASVKYPTPDHKNHKFAKDGFDNYRGRVRIDDVMFSYIVRIGKNQEKAMFYDINLEVESVILPSVKTRQKYKMDSTSNDIVSQDDSAVNTNSMQNLKMYSVKRAESAIVEEDFFDDAGIVEEKTADVLLRMPEPPKENLKTRVEAAFDYATRKLVDSGNAFKRIGKKMNDDVLYAYYDMAKRGRTSAMYCIEKAQKDINGKTVGKGLIEIFEPVKAQGDEYHKEFSEYLFHMHNVDRMKYDKPVFGWNVTSEMSEEKANELLMKHPEFLGLAEEVYKYVDNELKYAADSGLVSQSYYNNIRKKYPHYVPTYRDYEARDYGVHKGGGKKGKLSDFVVSAEGGTENLLPILQTLEQKTIKERNQGQINVLLNRVLAHAVNDKGKMSEFVTRVTDGKADKNDINTFTFYRNGEAVTLHISDSLNEGIKSLVQDYKEQSPFKDAIIKLNNSYKASITSWSPMFTLKNFARDIQDTVFYSKDSIAFAKAYPKAWKEMTTGGEMWELYCYLGGFDSGILDAKTGLPIKPKGIGKVSDRIQYINYIVEQSPRFAEFLATVEKGGTGRDNLAQAMLNSANVTVNFNRSGTITKVLNQTFVPFLNPSVQGMSNNFRILKESKNFRAWGGVIIKAALFGVAPAVINNLMYDDDEDYENLYQRDKDTNYIFKMQDGKFVKIPKGRLLSAMGATTNFITNLAEGKDVTANEYLSLMYENLGPVNPLTSNIAAPVLLAKMNRTWYGGEIESQRMENYFPYERYDSTTSEISKAIGRVLRISPMKIDYVLDSYSGVFGDFILPWTSAKGVTNPADAFTRAFVIDPVYSNNIAQDYYKKLELWKNKKNSYSNDKKPIAATVVRYLNSCSNAVSNLNEKLREAENERGKEKFDKLKETRVIKNATLKDMTLQLPEVIRVAHKLYSEADYKKYVEKYGEDGEQKYIDYLYREMNKEAFGAEYALQMYNKETYKKAQNVYKKGVSYDSFYNCYFGFKELGEDAKADDKRAWLMESKDFSSGEKTILDKNLISRYSMVYNDKNVDYSNENTFVLSQMSEAAQRKKARFPDMSAEDYSKYYKAYSSGKKKAEKIERLVEAGMTYTAAEEFYKKVSKK